MIVHENTGVKVLKDPREKDAEGTLDDLVTELEEQVLSGELTPTAMATTAQRLGEALALRGEYRRAGDAFARAVTANKTLFGGASAETVESLTGLGLALLEQESFSPAAAALGRALQARMLDPSERVPTATAGMTKNLDGLAGALASQPAEEGQEELAGALSAVDHINRVAWHYFVHDWPFEGEEVMAEALGPFRKETARLGPSRPRDLVISAYLFNLGFLRLSVLGQYESAAEALHEALSLRVSVLGGVHTLTVEATVSRGWALMLTGETELAVDELISTAEALLSAGRAATAERLLRQALEGSSNPLGIASYSHVCYTQHVNMLRGWGKEGAKKADTFVKAQMAISQKAMLPAKDGRSVRARKVLARALTVQAEVTSEKGELLPLSRVDKDQLWEEVKWLMK